MLAFVSVGLVGYFWITSEYERFKREKVALTEEYFAAQKALIKNETEKVIDYIAFKKSQAVNRLQRLRKAGVIESAQYAEQLDNQIKREVLALIETISFGDEGCIFAGQYDGLSLSGPAKGRNMIDVTDAHGIKIVQQLIKAARSGGGYVSYVRPKFDSDVTYDKLSYTMAIPEWQWYVGAGVNVDRIETVLQAKKAALQKRVKNYFIEIAAILAAVLLFILLVAKFVSARTKQCFDSFTKFFSKAATESVTTVSGSG
ncbi:MAG: cache domain-containing protein [Deltaproteobacteria bacterium]|nr:cache domain-containing protein [Deltaproteobacteria bacterium]